MGNMLGWNKCTEIVIRVRGTEGDSSLGVCYFRLGGQRILLWEGAI